MNRTIGFVKLKIKNTMLTLKEVDLGRVWGNVLNMIKLITFSKMNKSFLSIYSVSKETKLEINSMKNIKAIQILIY